MCDYYFQRMDEDHGDLADVVRAGGRSTGLLSNADVVKPLLGDDPASWQQQLNRDFGDPFTYVSDPLLNPFAAYAGIGGGDGRDQQQLLAPPPEKASCIIGGTSLLPQLHTISPPPSSSRLLMRPTPAVASGEMMVKVAASAAAACSGGVQISPHGASPGIKRRKSQAKKVVCIPAAPAAVTGSNRPSAGEVVPSDLWAWRKYGQKPIKGSPYPRGYYRCSSSKGCSARKQVERSRTEPNMLVITYTSEHNHPWPTQRNALAGSIRSHLSKSSSQRPPSTAGPTIPDIEQWPMSPGLVKEEATDDDQFDYKPMVPEPDQPDDFFSDLAELESDPMNLIFSKGFGEDDKQKEEEEEVMAAKAAADPLFDMFDWDTGSS
ncbi:probable WRKY transcription factor 14 [Zingiber officinale]|uniref:probable WRKY transcription factor 14 n=1 Tax=Zingiber officinale TaxID=94328 RepID=UPI001C4B0B21|nr:probable WRKY transcription factor 14 [Zingiber officinale]